MTHVWVDSDSLAERDAEIDRLRQRAVDRAREIDTLRAEAIDRGKEIEHLACVAANLRAKHDGLCGMLAADGAEIDKLRRENADLAEASDLQKIAGVARGSEIERLRDEATELRRENAELRATLAGDVRPDGRVTAEGSTVTIGSIEVRATDDRYRIASSHPTVAQAVAAIRKRVALDKTEVQS